MGIKKESTEVRKEQIVRAALGIIGKDGIQGLTTSGIAKAVGISEANIYRHFKNKDAILTATVEDLEDTISNILKAVTTRDIPPLDKLAHIFKLHLSHIQENKGVPRLVFSSELHFRHDLRDKLSSLIDRYLKMLTGILDEGVEDGSVKSATDTAAMAGLFVGMIQLSALRWSLSDFKTSLLGDGEKLWKGYRKCIEAKGRQT
ncbi:MAG: TetR/AcrR family transcriptional regulator [Deltaproteobacteria bacterium]